jgi:hypothetical protein
LRTHTHDLFESLQGGTRAGTRLTEGIKECRNGLIDGFGAQVLLKNVKGFRRRRSDIRVFIDQRGTNHRYDLFFVVFSLRIGGIFPETG